MSTSSVELAADEIMRRWGEIKRHVEIEATQCLKDPVYAARHGFVRELPEMRISLFGDPPGRPPVNHLADWLQTCARVLVDKAYQWEIMQTIGGGAFLVLKAYEPRKGSLES